MAKRYFIALLAGIIMGGAPAMAQTQEVVDPTLFADANGLNKLLQLQGIDPAKVKWGTIDPICIGLKTDEDETAFNRCRYERIVLKRTHGAQQPTQPINPALFTDSIGLNKLLQAQDIDPAKVSWGSIDPMCLGLKTDDSEVAFNRCRYEKLITQQQFTRDSHICARRAEANSLNPETLRTHTVTDSADNSRVVQETSRPVSFNRCMLEIGWADPRDWTAGYSYPPTSVIP